MFLHIQSPESKRWNLGILVFQTSFWNKSRDPALPQKASLAQRVDGGTDLKSRTQFDIHGGDEMIFTQE